MSIIMSAATKQVLLFELHLAVRQVHLPDHGGT